MPDEQQSRTALTAERADRVAFFDATCTGFERAAGAAGGTVDRFFRVGTSVVCLRFAGDAVAGRLVPALTHLAIPPLESADLTVLAWDSASTDTPLPLLPGSLVELVRSQWYERLSPCREIRGCNDERIRATFHPGPNILSLLDAQRGLGCYWVPSAEQVPYWEASAPFGVLFSRWLAGRDCHYVHAAGVGTAAGGVLLAGKGGSGKSTTTLACLGSDLGLIGDDYCLLADGATPHAHSLYCVAKLIGEEDLQRLPRLAAWVSNQRRAAGDKLLIPLDRCAGGQLLRGFPVKAVLVPRITGGTQTRARPISAGEALLALAPTSLLQFAGSRTGTLGAMARLVKRVPAFVLELGSDVARIPPAILRLLQELGAGQGASP
jgi:hypothetical protein